MIILSNLLLIHYWIIPLALFTFLFFLAWARIIFVCSKRFKHEINKLQ